MPLFGGVFNFMEALFSAGKIHPLMKEEGIVTPPVSEIGLLFHEFITPIRFLAFSVLSIGLEKEAFKIQLVHDCDLCIIAFPLDCSVCLW